MNYKKILNVFILLGLFSGFLFCGQKEDDATLARKLHYSNDESSPLSMYILWLQSSNANEFEDHKVKESKAKESLDSFFGNEKYIVISDKKYKGYNNIKIYVAIKECHEVRRGASKGIFVDDKGNQLLFFNMKRGVYTPEKTILDLAKLGFTDESPLCFAIGDVIDYLELQVVDKDKCVTASYHYWRWEKKPNKISHYYLITDTIEIAYDNVNNKIDFSLLCDGDYADDEDRYEERRKDFAVMKEYKAKGYRVYVPEKPLKEDVEIAKKIHDEFVLDRPK